MDPHALHLLQLALERKAIDEDGRLRRIPGPEPDEIPRVAVVRLRGRGPRTSVRDDLPAPVRERLLALDPERGYTDTDAVRTILADLAPCTEWDEGRSYIFDASPETPADVVRLGPDDRDLLLHGPDPGMADTVRRRPVHAVLRDGRVASASVSAREDDRAAEVWVISDGHHRRRGFAKRVVAAWAAEVLGAGKVAFYSHSTRNTASAGVARSLGLTPWMDQVAYA